MYSFDGQYKIGLKQNLGGASKQVWFNGGLRCTTKVIFKM